MVHNYNTINVSELQYIPNENVEKIAERLRFKNQIAPKFDGILSENQYRNYRQCGQWLYTEPDTGRIRSGNFCKSRFCPVCNRRSAGKKWAEMYDIISRARREMRVCFAFLTVTVRNVPGSELSAEISRLMKSVDRYHKRAIFRDNVIGYFRSMEITYNSDAATFHPHYHYILCLPATYTQHMVSTYDWRTTWEQCARINYTSQCKISMIRDTNIAAACAECAKYAVKISGVIGEPTDVIETMVRAVRGRRLLAYGGAFKIWHRENEHGRNKPPSISELQCWGWNKNNYQKIDWGDDNAYGTLYEHWAINGTV